MTGPVSSGQPHSVSGVDHSAAFAQIRSQLADLGSSIESLRGEADRLLESASVRTALAVLDPPAMIESAVGELEGTLETIGRHQGTLETIGRHAANVPEEFDPAPYDPDEGGEPDDVSGAFDRLAAAPAFGEDIDADPKLPPVDLEMERPSLLEPSSEPPIFAGTSPETRESDDADTGATVLEFAPRPTPAGAVDGGAPSVPVFGEVLVSDPDTRAPAADNANEETDDEDPPPPVNQDSPFDDGLDAIAQTESTAISPDWNSGDEGEAAFEKFFSSDVEPDPAQRWLLSD